MMKKVWACLPLAVCCSAYAQSNVTLYGVVDSAIDYTNNQGGSSSWQAKSGGRAGNWFGLRAVEDLGGNLKAIAVLEEGFNLQNGASIPAGAAFGQKSTVGLSGNWGTVSLGNQYSVTYDYFLPYSTSFLFAGGLGATAGDVDGSWTYKYVSNAIRYDSPVYHGLKYSAMMSLGGTAGDFARNRTYGVASAWTHGGLDLAAGYMNLRTPATSIFGGSMVPVAGAPFSNPITNPIFQNYVSAVSQQVLGAGASYKFGNAQMTFRYSNVRFLDIVRTAANPNAPRNAVFNNYQVNFNYAFTPAAMAGVGYQYAAAPGSRYHSYEAGATYLLSKSTFVYALTVWQHASGIDSTGRPAVADNFAMNASTTPNQVVVRFGIRKNF